MKKEYDFECDDCGAGFNTLDGLSWHRDECKARRINRVREMRLHQFKWLASAGWVLFVLLLSIVLLSGCGPSAQERAEDPNGVTRRGERFEVIHNVKGTGDCVLLWYSGYSGCMVTLPKCKICNK